MPSSRAPIRALGHLAARAVTALLLLGAAAVSADVVLDGSFGASDLETEQVAGRTRFLVTEQVGRRSGLDRRGANLLHSFSEFRVGQLEDAVFSADPDLATRHIFARITGPLGARVDGGLISLVPGADLWLLAPGGVIFGRTASIDVPGSLHLSSAPVLRLSDGAAVAIDAPGDTILSSAAPSAFGFLPSDRPYGVVRLNGAAVFVEPGEDVSLVGGDVTLQGFGGRPNVRAPGGRVQLVSVASPRDVPVDARALDLEAVAPDALGRVNLRQGAIIDASGAGGQPAGEILIRGGRFTMSGGALTNAHGAKAAAAASGIDVEVTGQTVDGGVEGISLSAGARIASASTASSAGAAVRLAGPAIALDQGARLVSEGTSSGPAPDVHLRAPRMRIDGGSEVFSRSLGSGAPGTLDVGADQLRVGPGASLGIESRADGSGGSITLEALHVDVDGGSITTQTASGSTASGGSLSIEADTLGVTGGQVGTLARGSGRGGDVRVRAGAIDLVDAGRLQTSTEASGRGGDLQIDVGATSGRAPTASNAEVFGRLHADNALGGDQLAGLAAVTLSVDPGAGRGGDVVVRTGRLVLIDGAQVSATTEGAGPAGTASITATGDVTLRGRNAFGPAAIVSQVGVDESQTAVTGAGGTVHVIADEISLEDGGQISGVSFGRGDAGRVDLEAHRSIRIEGGPLHGPSVVATRSAGEGDAGVVTLSAPEVLVTAGGLVTASATAIGDAGSVVVSGQSLTVAGRAPGASGDPSAIRGETTGTSAVVLGDEIEVVPAGRGGTVLLRVDEIRIGDGGIVSTRSLGEGPGGEVRVEGAKRFEVADGGVVSAIASGVDRDFATGQGGLVRIDAGAGGALTFDGVRDLVVRDGGSITTESTGDGDAGRVDVLGAQTVQLIRDARLASDTSGTARGGPIRIRTTGSVSVLDGSRISARSVGSAGDAGDVDIDAGLRLVLAAGAIETSAEQAFGGNVTLAAADRLEMQDSRITTSVAEADGDGGNIAIDPRFVILDRSTIQANARAGNGGNIGIVADQLLVSDDSVIEASSELGIDGTIRLTAPETDLVGDVGRLPSEFSDLAALLQDRCSARTASAGSLVVRGRDHVPPPPHGALAGFHYGGSAALARHVPEPAAESCPVP